MSELEKFKRRMIRMVARLHVQQKKPEDELWEYLRKQTKCDCKWLWERMRALTLKRLKRLLIAEDRQENIPAVARMSLTDWLLFDCILVHEKIDVIGLELQGEGRSVEPRQLFELFSLVQKFELEGLKGEELARAWTAATVSYNSLGRQCSPMLLQLRWYQLKEVTRTKFYNFWFSYRGNAKLLHHALKDKPTRLQSAIGKRYPHIITTPFLQWEELIERRLIIMPPEFEIQMKSRSNLPKPVDDNEADLVLLEPQIETIDLGADSDSDKELRDEVEGSKATQMIADEDIAAVQSITMKQEPMDEEDHIEESINLDSAHMEAIDAEIDHIEGIEALENTDIPIQIDDTEKPKPPVKKKRGRRKKLPEPIEIGDEESIGSYDSMEYTEGDTQCSMEENVESNELDSTINESLTPVPSIDDASTIDISSCPTVSRQIDNKPQIDLSLATNDDNSELIEDGTTSNAETLLAERISPIADITSEEEPTEVQEANITGFFESDMNESPEMPQITNVFGNVNLPDEALQKLSSYLEKTKNETPVIQEQNGQDVIEEDIIKTEVIDSSYAPNVECSSDVQATTVKADENDIYKMKTSDEKLQDNLVDAAIPNMTFEDDGIEFIDDGIVEEQEGEHIIKHDDNGIKAVKKETSDGGKAPEQSQSIDLKLLMVPVVYTKKLDHMEVLRNKPLSHVKGEDGIELILTESKPESKKSIQIEVEQQLMHKTVSDSEEDAHDDLFDKPDDASTSDSSDSEDEIPAEKIVPISSVLFKKPRNRDYSPLVICKNPDFNTRLKRLTAGFLSYTRNRFLLNRCKPLTIDLCKAFESKLVNNTVFFKQPAFRCERAVKEEKLDAHDVSSPTPPVAAQEDLVQAIDEQTTDSVQNLVNSMLEKALPPSARELNQDIRKEKEDSVDAIVERNKVIVLPHIDNVRRINQKLLVAEVSPMRIENINHDPPVSLVSTSMEKLNFPPVSGEMVVVEKPAVEKPVVKSLNPEITSGTVICSGRVINNVTHSGRIYWGKYKPQWRPEASGRVARGFWDRKKTKPNNIKRPEELLLSVDALNKMLNIIRDKDPIATHSKVSYKKNLRDKQRLELKRKVDEIQRLLTSENSRSDTDETQDADQQTDTNKRSSDEAKPTFASSKPKRGRPSRRGGRSRNNLKLDCSNGYGTYCCWFKFKQNHPRSMNGHPCDVSCVCCCKIETDPSIKKVCESIESVIEQSREIVDNQENNADILNKDDHNSCSLDNSMPSRMNTETSSFGAKDVVSNVIDISDGDNENSSSKKNDDNNDEIVDSNVNNENSSSQKNYDDNNYEIVDSNVIGLSDGLSIAGQVTVAANITIPGDINQTAPTEDCVILDSDDPETPEKQNTTKVKDNAEPPPKRKRGRPVKMPEPIPKVPKIKTTINSLRLRPLYANKKKEAEKSVLFLNSNHIRRSNHPIFLGKNKILLTDVPLPRNKDKPDPVEPSTALINTSMPLPQGVNLMLLPNGVLTCTVDPNVQLTTEEISNLGVIIECIQKQISSAISGASTSFTQLVSSSQQNASDWPTMTVPDITQNSYVDNLNDENDVQKTIEVDDNIQAISTTAESAESTANVTATESVTPVDSVILTSDSVPEINYQNTSESDKVMESSPMETENASTVYPSSEELTASEKVDPVPAKDPTNDDRGVESDKVMENTPMETENASTVYPSSEELTASEKVDPVPAKDPTNDDRGVESDKVMENTPMETEKASTVQPPSVETTASELTDSVPAHSTNDISVLESDKDKHSTTEEPNVNTVQDTKADTEPVNKKTILSDLMEMSGIFDEDIAPVDPTPQIPDVRQYPIAFEPPPLIPIPVANPTNLLPELTPITSFIELKYACAQNGNFFKLDLETKSLTPINVCIKRKEKPEDQPKQFVDLTEDADEEESTQNVTATEVESIPTFLIRKTKTKDASPSDQSLKAAVPAKPLRIFKVVHPFGSNVKILQKGKRTLHSNEVTVTLPVASKGKRLRKQNLAETAFEMPILNFLTNEEKEEHYEFDGSYEDTVAPAEDSDSSDDEPLAKKVRRKEEALKDAKLAKEVTPTVEHNDTLTPPVEFPVPENAQHELPPQNHDNELPLAVEQSDLPPAALEGSVEEQELPVEELDEDALEPTEVEFLSDQDNDEEDCILGF